MAKTGLIIIQNDQLFEHYHLGTVKILIFQALRGLIVLNSVTYFGALFNIISVGQDRKSPGEGMMEKRFQ